jgi:hypothetical protein
MSYSRIVPVVVTTAVLCLAASTAHAQRRGGGGHGSGGHVSGGRPGVIGRSVPRGSIGPRYYGAPRIISPRIVGVVPYRPYYYPYRPGLTIGFYAGFGYRYPYGYGYPYGYYGYPYPYGAYGYGAYGYGAYGYPLPPAGYVSAQPGAAYGGVRIEGAPRDAQVFVDGYYMGVAEDFDGPVQHLNLQAGAHRVEIRVDGYEPIAFDVNVQPGQTITYHANIR